MSERKVLNKYYPPEYDPEKFPSLDRPSKKSGTVRLMAPFSMRCSTCGEFIYKSKKFNARKENTEEFYLTIQILRFYIRCPKCAAEITFKTDPKNTDYQVEHGATRNYEPWKEEKEQELKIKKQRDLEETSNPLKALENKTMDSRKEIEVFEALDEIRAINDRNFKFDSGSVMDILYSDETKEPNEEEFFAKQQILNNQITKRPIDIEEDPETNRFIQTLFKKSKVGETNEDNNNHAGNNPKVLLEEELSKGPESTINLKDGSTKSLLCSLPKSSQTKPKISGILIKKKTSV